MKRIGLITSLSLILWGFIMADSALGWEGGSHSGGGMPGPKLVRLICDGDFRIRFMEFKLNSVPWASNAVWVTPHGQTEVEYSSNVSNDQSKNRIISYTDAFCERSLVELAEAQWMIRHSCEGKQFTTICSVDTHY